MKCSTTTKYTDPTTGESITLSGDHSEAEMKLALKNSRQQKSLAKLNADPAMTDFLRELVRS
jgi:hypothetical protein